MAEEDTRTDSEREEKKTTEVPVEPTYPCYCTFACSHKNLTYQAIFICRTCSTSPEEMLCVCEGCANHCHEAAYHDEVEYVGMGMAYCDCSSLGGCKIFSNSKINVEEWKIAGLGNCSLPQTEGEEDPHQYLMDTYTIPELHQHEAACRDLVEEACMVVKESKETFWLSSDQNKESWCRLEHMAWRLFEGNNALYNLELSEGGGAEWWIQVKKNLASTGDGKDASGSDAVDLHYDKDEELAEKYGLGAFPILSTVTYLTDDFSSNPTVIFGRTYEQPDDEIISNMLVSHPVLGKHLVFDGRLLHGAPNAELHKNYLVPDETKKKQASSDVRVTLLVNVWANRKPAGVAPLCSQIRENVNNKRPRNGTLEGTGGALDFQKRLVEQVVLEEEEGQEEVLDRIELPFVCKGITWESEDDESTGLVVVTCPPPEHKADSVCVRFGPGVQAYLDQPHGEGGYVDTRPGSSDLAYEQAYL